MSCALFIRTYWKDIDWLRCCLRAIERHAHGFDEVAVAIPVSSKPWIARVRLPGWVRWIEVPAYADDYLGQQVTKLHADTLVDADYIAHLDADCLLRRAMHAGDLIRDGRPTIVTRPTVELGRHHPWRAPTETYLGHAVELDYMQQPPFVYPRWLYAALRRHALERFGEPIDAYILRQPPRGYSEFNVLGAWAHRHAPDAFRFIPATDAGDAWCDWHWSWGGLPFELRAELESEDAAAT
ncbi:MAG: hypothetical protein JSR59_10850 [Proteobacteria bacterium]|nr:hypothetical protein [Pseudomonadota bacterium]